MPGKARPSQATPFSISYTSIYKLHAPYRTLKMFSLITYLNRWYIINMCMKHIKYFVNIFIKIVKQNLRFLSFRILFSREWVKLTILCRSSWKQYGTIHVYFHYHHYARLLTGTEHINVCRVSCGGVSNMLLVLSITFYFHYNMWGCMCLSGPFQLRWLTGYVYNHIIIIIKSEVSTFPFVIICFRGCVPKMFVM